MRCMLAVCLLWMLPGRATACDVCGCSGAGAYFGVLPAFQQHFIGMRTSARNYQFAHTAHLLDAGVDVGQNRFWTAELTGRFVAARRWQITAAVPFHRLSHDEPGISHTTRGLGDIGLSAMYLIAENKPESKLVQNWWLGLGVTLPTGAYRLRDGDGLRLNPNLQPGTGAIRSQIQTFYVLRYGQWGLSADAIWQKSAVNSLSYQRGDLWQGGFRMFSWQKLSDKVSLLPNCGLTAEYLGADLEAKRPVEATGGHMAAATLGLDVYFDRLAAGLTWQKPLRQNLGDGAIAARARLYFTINYIF